MWSHKHWLWKMNVGNISTSVSRFYPQRHYKKGSWVSKKRNETLPYDQQTSSSGAQEAVARRRPHQGDWMSLLVTFNTLSHCICNPIMSEEIKAGKASTSVSHCYQIYSCKGCCGTSAGWAAHCRIYRFDSDLVTFLSHIIPSHSCIFCHASVNII